MTRCGGRCEISRSWGVPERGDLLTELHTVARLATRLEALQTLARHGKQHHDHHQEASNHLHRPERDANPVAYCWLRYEERKEVKTKVTSECGAGKAIKGV